MCDVIRSVRSYPAEYYFAAEQASARRAVEIFLHQWRLVEGQPISVEALERPVEENRPPPNPVEGAGTGPRSLRPDVTNRQPMCAAETLAQRSVSAFSGDSERSLVYITIQIFLFRRGRRVRG